MPRRTPLHARHLEAGARMAPFAGFEMPIVYDSIVAEHRAVRERAGVFDVSHMGEIRLRGRDAVPLGQRLFTNRVADLAPGRVRYGLLCQEDGGVIDDATLYRVGDDELLFCVNAANTAADLAWMRELTAADGLDCEIADESDATALLAVQGPRAVDIVGSLLEGDARPPRRWRFREAELAGAPVWLSRTGYTGEDGYEIYGPAEEAVRLWDALRTAGGDALAPAGLGARDTLRTEMGYALYGHELDRAHNPLEAGLERFVAFGTGFVGESALEPVRERGPSRRLVGLLLDGRAVARPGHRVLVDGEPAGEVVSGTYGPSVERSIAIGYVPAGHAEPGTRLDVEIRGRRMPSTVTRTPFYRRKD